MEWFESDHAYINAAIEQIQPYLSSKNLYWPLGQLTTPLTIGNLLFALRRLSSNGDYQDFVEDVNQQLETIRRLNRYLFEQKETQEIKSRIRQWAEALEDWNENGLSLSSLSTEGRNRAIIELIMKDLGRYISDESTFLESVDEKYRSTTTEGDFLWEEDLRSQFPADTFWFLWRKPVRRMR